MATPEEERVRRLLAASGPVPMPDDVRDRLHRVVADLAAERAAQDAAGSGNEPEFVDGGRRPQRRWPRLLVAAATVAVVGTGIGVAVAQLAGSGGTSAGTASSSAQENSAGASGTSPQRHEVRSQGSSPGAMSLAEGRAQSMLHSDSLRADIRRVEHFAPQLRAAEVRRVPRGCATPATGPRDQLFAVRLDGRRATLLLQPAKDGTRVARIYPCDNPRTPVARAEVPAR